MRVPRIYQDHALTIQETIILDSRASHYVGRVLRLKHGAPLKIFNGQGGVFEGVLQIEDKILSVTLTAFHEANHTSPLAIHLAQVLTSSDKMDFIIQKAVELGVTAITPLFSERCEIKFTEKRLAKRMAHWQQVMISACEQCGQNRLPTLHTPETFTHFLGHHEAGQGFILSPRGEKNLEHTTLPSNITLLIGPEGGFSETEEQVALDHHYDGIQLGPRTLRMETAALATLAIFQHRWGDL
jgi:16S rRNA (uracil1498-N3)-methyltransferase